jgi:hypothetical protein
MLKSLVKRKRQRRRKMNLRRQNSMKTLILRRMRLKRPHQFTLTSERRSNSTLRKSVSPKRRHSKWKRERKAARLITCSKIYFH